MFDWILVPGIGYCYGLLVLGLLMIQSWMSVPIYDGIQFAVDITNIAHECLKSSIYCISLIFCDAATKYKSRVEM